MIVTISNKNKYFVGFNYSRASKRFGEVHRKNTECFIKMFEEGKKGKDLKLLSRGRAELASGDQFNKKIGRKIAFTRALFSLYPSINSLSELSIEQAEINRKNRAKFWKSYLKQITI